MDELLLQKKMKIAVVPLGYADGLPRSLSNKGYLFCKGNKCKIVGRVCMDLTMIDVTNIKYKNWKQYNYI